MDTDQETYFDLQFGKCSQTARRDDPDEEVITSNKENITPSSDTTTRLSTPSDNPTFSNLSYSNFSYSNFLVGRAQRDTPLKSQHNSLDSNVTLTKSDPQSLKSSSANLLKNIEILGARDLPHPRHLRKRKNSRMPQEKKVATRMGQGMMVENYVKQTKFYCTRVQREQAELDTGANKTNQLKSLSLDGIEIPPLPEIPYGLYGNLKRPDLDSFNMRFLPKPPGRTFDFTPNVTNKIQYDPKPQDVTPNYDRFGLSFGQNNLDLNFNNNRILPTNSNNPTQTMSTAMEADEEEWFSQNWKPRCIFPPYTEE